MWQPRILSCIAGYYRCFGVPSQADAQAWGCNVVNTTDCRGRTTAFYGRSPLRMKLLCHGQQLHNVTSQDGTPVTFSLPVDVSSVEASHFRWVFADGSTGAVGCVVPGAGPASEPNELQSLALLGNAGGWGSNAVGLEVVGPLMLIAPDGSRVSAQGLAYRGAAMGYADG